MFLPAAALALLSGCTGKPTYPRETLPQEVERMCRKEYDLAATSRLLGRTLYVSCTLDGLVGKDLSLQKESLQKLEGAMLSTTRVALSTDADVQFLVCIARDARLGTNITLVRYFPDIKGLLYFKLSRTDFEDRLVLESDGAGQAETPEKWHEITMMEFVSRLAASRLQRQFTYNPLVSVFLQIHRVTARVEGSVLALRVDKFEKAESTNILVDEILRAAVEDVCADVIKKYDRGKVIRSVTVGDDSGKQLLAVDVKDFLNKKKKKAAPLIKR